MDASIRAVCISSRCLPGSLQRVRHVRLYHAREAADVAAEPPEQQSQKWTYVHFLFDGDIQLVVQRVQFVVDVLQLEQIVPVRLDADLQCFCDGIGPPPPPLCLNKGAVLEYASLNYRAHLYCSHLICGGHVHSMWWLCELCLDFLPPLNMALSSGTSRSTDAMYCESVDEASRLWLQHWALRGRAPTAKRPAL